MTADNRIWDTLSADLSTSCPCTPVIGSQLKSLAMRFGCILPSRSRYRNVQKLLLYRGIDVSHEAIRAWCNKFGQQYAREIRRRRPRVNDKWHLDEVVVTINGEKYYLWRAVDAEGNVLDVLLQRHRDKAAAKKFFRKLLKKQGFAPRVLVTDKLKSYGAAKRELLPDVEHRQHKGLNNPCENSHQPTRMRERRMR